MKTLIKFLWSLYIAIGTVAYVLACLAPYINPCHSSILYFSGLAFPIILINFILIAFYMGIIKKKFIFLFLLIPGILFALNYLSLGKSDGENESASLTVHTINAYSANLLHEKEQSFAAWNTYLDNEVNQPDIICVQELPQKLGALYTHNLKDYEIFTKNKSNLKIASRFPIINGGEIKDSSGLRFSIFADVLVHSDTIRIYNFHLYSNKISAWLKTAEGTENPNPEKIIEGGDRIKNRIFEAATQRSTQAKKLKWHIEACRYKTITCGDMNETAQSFSYQQVKNKQFDTFRKGSTGMHPTYRKNPSWVRIDYIFCDKSFEVKAYDVLPFDISDHRVVAVTIQ